MGQSGRGALATERRSGRVSCLEAPGLARDLTADGSERAHYFDAGIEQQIGARLHVGMDAYCKTSHEQLDDGLFGQTLILSAFNHRFGRINGLEFSTSYSNGGFSAWA